MKPSMIAGLVLVAVGLFILLRGINYGSQRSVMRIGDVSASVTETRTIPLWVGGVAIVGGLVLAGATMRRRRGA